jgi:hypothetical protein
LLPKRDHQKWQTFFWTNKEKREDTNCYDKRGNITVGYKELKDYTGKILNVFANKFDKLDEMNKFLERQKWSEPIQEKIKKIQIDFCFKNSSW